MTFVSYIAAFESISLGRDEFGRRIGVQIRHFGERVTNNVSHDSEFFGYGTYDGANFLRDGFVFLFRFSAIKYRVLGERR